MCLQAKDCWETIFPCFVPREIDFVKKEEELKKTLDEKDKWYKEQLESLQNRVRPKFWGVGVGGAVTLTQHSTVGRNTEMMLFCPQIAVLESRGTSVVECQRSQDSAADDRLSSQDPVTNAQSVDSLLGTKACYD